jgi:hypothetical protein
VLRRSNSDVSKHLRQDYNLVRMLRDGVNASSARTVLWEEVELVDSLSRTECATKVHDH